MKRSLIVLCAAALLTTLPLANVAEARRHGRPGWPNRMMSRGSCRRANPARRPWLGWQGWRGRRGWRDTQPEEVMVEIVHVLHVVYLGEGGIASDMVFCELTEVPESQVTEHLAHGDRIVGDGTVLYPLDDGLRGTFEWLYEIDLSNAQYYFYIYY